MSQVLLPKAATLFLLLAAAASALTWLVRKYALAKGMLDRPNARSSHTVETPRGGGISIVLVASIGTIIGWGVGAIDGALAAVVLFGGSAVAIVGYLDDRGHVSVRARLAVHFASAILCVWILGGPGTLSFGTAQVDLGWIGDVLSVVAVVWMLNLFNFMDGIDGIAATEAAFVAIAGALITGGGLAFGLIIGAACLGFLVWNWPPARIFMGDVGSGYLGYVLASLMLAGTSSDPVALWVWMILASIFIVDATVTLTVRLIRGERVYQAHRSHVYQRLARRWGSHLRVTSGVIGLNVGFLLPCAWLAYKFPQCAIWIVGALFLGLGALAVVAGAGQKEANVSPAGDCA
jgi:Fuc2NAc and GlcNAc transferase